MKKLYIRLNPNDEQECNKILDFLSTYDSTVKQRITRNFANMIEGCVDFPHSDKDKVIEVGVDNSKTPEIVDFIHTQTKVWWMRHDTILEAFYHRKDNLSQRYNVAAKSLKPAMQKLNPQTYSDENFRFTFQN